MKRRKWRAALAATLRLASNQSGQALREYALVIAVVAVAATITLGAVGLAIAGSLPASLDGLLQALDEVQQP